MEYYGKIAYQGAIVENYERDRVVETIWLKEQDWVADYTKGIPANSSLLDLPVGTGRFLPIYAQKKIKVFGFDISDDMITQSTLKLTSLINNHALTELKVSDAEHIDLADNAVDYVICFRLFHLIPFEVATRVIAEFYRITKKEVVIQVFKSSLNFTEPERKRTFKDLLSAAKRRLLNNKKPTQTEPATDIKAWSHINNFSYSYDQLYNQFKLAGFSNIEVKSMDDTENPAVIFLLSK